MRSPVLLLLAAAALSFASLCSRADASKLVCGVCEALVDEVNQSILETTHTHSVQTRFRVDEKKRTPYARTEHNLFDILESDSLHTRFRKYGVVQPWTKTAKEMKKGYERGAEEGGAAAATTQATPEEPQVAEAQEPAAPVGTTTTDENAAPATDAAAAAPAADGSAAPATDPAAAAAAATPAAPTFTPFRATGSTPLALQFNHPHLALSSLRSLHNLMGIDSSASIHSEIRSTLDAFLEEYLDEALMMFHKDVPELKQKLCVEVTEACKPAKPRSKKQKMEGAAKKQDEAAKSAAETVKDEL